MTATLDRPTPGHDLPEPDEEPLVRVADPAPTTATATATGESVGPIDVRPFLRPAIAAACASAGAALVAGGSFGSWAARLVGVLAVLLGAGWALLAVRNPSRGTVLQLGLLPTCIVAGLPIVVAKGGSPAELGALVRAAIESGLRLRPPVPFDAGWVPIFMVVFGLLGFASAWVATAMERDRLGIAIPLPVIGLAAMTQPESGQLLAGVFAFVPLVAALAVLFGGDGVDTRKLSGEFERRRLVRGLAFTVVTVIALVGLSRANVLFPAPAYDPNDRAQKPRPIPLSQIQDVVLFEVRPSDPSLTGPWRTGVLDTYDGEAWRLPPFDAGRLVEIPGDGVVDPVLVPAAEIEVSFTTRDLTNATALPGVTGLASVRRDPALADTRYDPRTGTLRIAQGRLPNDATYTMRMPRYPTAGALAAAGVGTDRATLAVPAPPSPVQALLDAAPASPPYARMDFLRSRLRDLAVAEGGGVPIDITPARVAAILDGPDHTATPFEIVAAEAMLARWAGVPSRIGFGFDGLNDEAGVKTVRPRNAAQWLEVHFDGHGWVPLIEPPKQAKNQLDDEEQLFDPDTLATDEVAVDVFVPVRLTSFQELYQRIRAILLLLAPYAVIVAAAVTLTPATMRQWRRAKRRRWARAEGPLARITVEYAELRDLAYDLNVGDPLDSPLEYLSRLTDDEEHQELAWLVARSLYGDLRDPTEEHARDAEDLAASLRRRLWRGQPFGIRAVALVSRASLRDPFTAEVPNVVLIDPVGRLAAWRSARRRARRTRRPSWIPQPLDRLRRRTS